MKKSLAAAIAVLLLIGLVGLASLGWFGLPTRLGWPRQPSRHLVLYGNVDIRQVELGFRVGGRVSAMLHEEGEQVEKGEILARLDDRPYRDEVRAAEAEVAAQEATLAKLVAGPRQAEIDQARAELAERRAALANAEITLERSRRLLTNRAIAQAEFDRAQADQQVAAARVASAEEALRLLEEGTRPEDLANARAQLGAAQARLASAQTALGDTVLRAPSSGTLLSRVREPGAIVAPGEVVYVLSLAEPVWVRAYVPEPYLGRVRPGMPVQVVSDTAPRRPHPGHIGYISPVAEFTPKSVETPELRTDLVYRLRITIQHPDGSLLQGMPVTIRIPLDPAPRRGRPTDVP